MPNPPEKKEERSIEPIFCTGNKIATFFEAGLPLICDNRIKFIGKLMEDYRAGVFYNQTNIKDIKKILKKQNNKFLEKNIENARQDFLMEKHFPRLESFVKKVVARKKTKY